MDEPTQPTLPPDFPDRAQFEREWVEALRSGKYEQGRNYLHPDGLWCCLGVACDIAVQHGIGEWDGPEYVSGNYFPGPDESMETALPFWLAAFLGRDDLGRPIGGYGTLSYLNDMGVSFRRIADVIEGSITYNQATKEVFS